MPSAYDLCVVGSGPAGYVAAIRASQLGMKVALVERDRVGGICLNWGCIPTKSLLKNAEVYTTIQHAADYGITVENVSLDFAKVIGRSRDVAERLSKGIQFLLKKSKIDLITGLARFTGAKELSVFDETGKKLQTLNSRFTLLATGGRPMELPGVPFDGERILSSRDAMTLKKQPKRLAIIGAGAIGVEFAYFYNAIGTEVTLIEMLPNIVPQEDEEVSKALTRAFKKSGIKVMAGTAVDKVESNDSGVSLTVTTQGKTATVKADCVLIGIGIRGNIEKLDLNKTAIQTDGRFIKTDAKYQTGVEGVFAVGDLIGPPLLAHVGSAEAVRAVEFMAGRDPEPLDYNNIPGCTYCQPQIASVGLTEKQATEQGIELKIGRFPFKASGKAMALGDTDGFVKVLYDAKYGEMLGMHIIGSEATEMIGQATIARTLETTYQEVLQTVHAHPTLSEAIQEATGDAFGEAIHI